MTLKRTRFPYLFPVLVTLIVITGWKWKDAPLFRLIPASTSGIQFANNLRENDTLNILNHANIYNGGGVGIGDFNNDGLPDVYFAGNMVSNKLYLNKGDLKFEDITEASKTAGEGRWCTGVSVVDINGDGLLDLYVAASFTKEVLTRTNLLYVNQGNDNSGVPVFKELASQYGIADTGLSTQGIFFDYDLDGDLDLYVVTNVLNDPKTPIRFRPKVTDGSALNNDRLYRNNGNNTFTNVSKQVGITIEGWGHAAAISDFNGDGWPDIYVANDFVSNDLLYINNKNGTFSNQLGKYFKHTSWNAMGTDVVDINNDGYADLISLEMLPETNSRKKRMLGGNEYYNYFNSAKFGYDHQYVRNTFQLNSGPTPAGHPVFSDVGFMAGVYQTDWSWCPLVADFDNDGFRDMIISNGLPRDVTDLDYIAYDNKQGSKPGGLLTLEMAGSLPIVDLPNYAFRNNGGYTFTNTSAEWGLKENSFSNGGAYVDLDNDGDLDFLINNINSPAFLYENTSNLKGEAKSANSVTINIIGKKSNTRGIGARVYLFADSGKLQYYEHQPSRGYLSSVDARAHFGLGARKVIDSIRIIWPDKKSQLISNVPANQPVSFDYKDAGPVFAGYPSSVSKSLLIPAVAINSERYKPSEKDFIDYNIQSTLPHKLSQFGPGIAVGDIDGNGFEDFYLGGSSEMKRVFFLQDATGKFKVDSTRFNPKGNPLAEDMGVLLFDVDNDKDLDLYVVTGSYEIPPNHEAMRDRLYMNDGKGRFTISPHQLPKELTNGSCVKAADFDGDGLLDLFVGGRVVSGGYPKSPPSYLLKNMGAGKFEDVTDTWLPAMKNGGMITDALFSDFDNDGKVDLVVTGEWTSIRFYKNTGNAFVENTSSGVDDKKGWWNSLTAADFDNDGDIDYVAGNLGLNSNYVASDAQPMAIYGKDFDDNGSFDAFTFCFLKAEDGGYKPFPMHARDDMITQMISIRKRFPTYKAYGVAALDDILKPSDREGAIALTANYMQSSYLENLGNSKFKISSFPLAAQAAPLFGMLSRDLNNDGNMDLIVVGNDYGMEPYSGRHDALNGVCMLGDGKGNFRALTVAESGLFVDGDAKGLASLVDAKGNELYVAAQNQNMLLAFVARKPAAGKWVNVKHDEFCAELILKDGTKKKVEFYYGSTYLSHSSRKLFVGANVSTVVLINFSGDRRNI